MDIAYRLLPYGFAVWLVLTADFGSGYLGSLVETIYHRRKLELATREPKPSQWDKDLVEADRTFLKHFASDCVLRLAFTNAALTSFISAIAATASTKSFGLLVTAIALLLSAYVPLFFYMAKVSPGDLRGLGSIDFDAWGKSYTLRVAPYIAYRYAAIAINALLVVITLAANGCSSLSATDSRGIGTNSRSNGVDAGLTQH